MSRPARYTSPIVSTTPADPFSIVSTNHAGHTQVENNAGCDLRDSRSPIATTSITVVFTISHQSLPEMTHFFNKPGPSCHFGRGHLRQPDRISRMPTSNPVMGMELPQAMRMLGHASVLNTLATSFHILCHFT